jgi:hypothetical protein
VVRVERVRDFRKEKREKNLFGAFDIGCIGVRFLGFFIVRDTSISSFNKCNGMYHKAFLA